MITLYNIPISGNCHKIRLLLNILNLKYKSHDLDLTQREQHSTDYLNLNPFAQAPVLTDGEETIRDSQAILVYLAKKYGGATWWSEDAKQLADIVSWLATAANEITYGPAILRAHYKFGRHIDIQLATETAQKVLRIINLHLSQHDWLARDRISIADIAVYPYLALAHEGHISIEPYKAILTWFERFENQPGYLSMPGIETR